MVQHQVITKRKMGIIYNYIDYKNKMPFFRKPIKITLANSPDESYYLVKNIVFKEKQILALKNDRNPETIFIVEAIIDHGKLLCISKLPHEYVAIIGKMIEESFQMIEQ